MSARGRVASTLDEAELTASSVLAGLVGLCVPALLARLLWRTHAEFRDAVISAVVGAGLGLLGLAVAALAVALLVRTARRARRHSTHEKESE